MDAGAEERGAPRLWLAPGTLDGPRPELEEGEARHATARRLRPGDRVVGIDGAGGSRPLAVVEVGRRAVRVEPAGPPERLPPPGAPGAALPSLAVAFALPRPGRAESLVERLTQLGAARLVPLTCRRTGPEARASDRRLERLERTAREALKQCGRAWLPELSAPIGPAELAAALPPAALLLDPDASEPLLAALERLLAAPVTPAEGPGGRPAPSLALVVGPEGGFAPEEREVLRGLAMARLGPHVLRIETAAEAATAVAVAALEVREAR